VRNAILDRGEVLDAYRHYYNAPLARHFELAGCSVETTASGATVTDEMGRQYLDAGTAHGIFGLGHCHPAVKEAVVSQLEGIAGPTGRAQHRAGSGLKRKLSELLPGDLNHVVLAGSGSEAVEIALRVALLARPGRTRLIAAHQGYHGKTLGALGAMGLPHLRVPFEPLWPDVHHVPYGDVEALAAAIGGGALAVLLEPVLGGGTIQVPPPDYLAEVRALCDQTGTILIVDEVQTGLGRTGMMFGIEHSGIVPDAIILSKTLTGGFVPVATTVVRESIACEIGGDADEPALFRSDSAGWPLVAAAASATVDYVVANSLARRAQALGAYLGDCLTTIAESFPNLIVDTPGIGLMRGLTVRNRVIEHGLWLQLRRRNVIIGLSLNAAASAPVLRIYPPLTIKREELDRVIEALYDALDTLQHMRLRAVYSLAAPALAFQHRLPTRVLAAVANQASSTPPPMAA
jgi:putrescine aminotransferase